MSVDTRARTEPITMAQQSGPSFESVEVSTDDFSQPLISQPRQPRQLQVRLQLPTVDSGTQTDVVCGASGTISPSFILHPYAYRHIPISAYLPTGVEVSSSPSNGSAQHPFNFTSYTNMSHAHENKDLSPLVSLDQKDCNSVCDFHSVVDNKPKKTKKSAVASYVKALRPWSFPGSLSPVVLGSCLAYKSQGVFDVSIFLTTVLTTLCVHAAGNLVNTYFDFVRGIDNKKSDDRTLVDSILTPNDVVTLGALFYVAGCVGFALLTLLSPARMEHLALIYFCGLSSSFLYTGGLGLKYIAMGDILIVLTFGPLTVVFSHLSQTGQLSLVPMVYAIPLAMNAEAILHTNNARDAESDRQAGAVTLAILLGKGGSYCLFCFLLFVPFLMFLTVGIHYCPWMLLPAAVIFMAFELERQFRRGDLLHLPQKVAHLNLLIGLFYTIGIFMANAGSLPSMTPLNAS